MSNPVIIFGAGNTGRGFLAHLCHQNKQPFVLVDSDAQKVESLRKAGFFEVSVLKKKKDAVRIPTPLVFAADDPAWFPFFTETTLVFTAVSGENLPQLAESLAKGLDKRYRNSPQIPMNIITCENLVDAGSILHEQVAQHLTQEKGREWLGEKIGFAEALVLKTCIADPDDPLSVIAQDFHQLPCDLEALRAPLPPLEGLLPRQQYAQQLTRKIYTYNCINAVICYLGAQKGYQMLYEAAEDVEIFHAAQQAAYETSEALIKEFGFNRKEQYEWVKSALDKFSDARIPDPISRNARHPFRKLKRNDRLVGPALLALKHSIFPEHIMQAIQATFEYEENGTSAKHLIKEKGMAWVLQEVCGLNPSEQLFNTLHEMLSHYGN